MPSCSALIKGRPLQTLTEGTNPLALQSDQFYSPHLESHLVSCSTVKLLQEAQSETQNVIRKKKTKKNSIQMVVVRAHAAGLTLLISLL